jgi:hypothetical protein
MPRKTKKNPIMDHEQYKAILHNWFSLEFYELNRRMIEPPTGKTRTLIQCAVWGEKYAKRFLNTTAATMKAPANIKAIRERGRILLFTDGAGFDVLWQQVRDWQADGVAASFVMIPPFVMDAMREQERMTPPSQERTFPLLGCTQNLSVQIAGRYGLGFHATFPDHYYSSEYFPNFFRLADQYEAISQTSVSADISVMPEVEKRMQPDGSLSLTPVELGDLAFANLHGQSAGNLMNKGAEFLGYPSSHCCIWQGRDKLFVHVCHMNAAYLSPRLCARAPVKYFSPIDCNLPLLMPNGTYIPEVSDNMTFIEVSDDSKYKTLNRLDIELFSAVCHYHTNFHDIFTPWFRAGCQVPISPQAEYMADDEIRRRQNQLIADVQAHKEIVRGRIRFENPTAAHKEMFRIKHTKLKEAA